MSESIAIIQKKTLSKDVYLGIITLVHNKWMIPYDKR